MTLFESIREQRLQGNQLGWKPRDESKIQERWHMTTDLPGQTMGVRWAATEAGK